MSMKYYSLIKKLDAIAMQEALKADAFCKQKPEEEHLTFTSYKEYRHYINNIELASFLGTLPYRKHACPICNQNEGFISYYAAEELWTHRCYAEKKTRNIISIILSIAGCSYSKAFDFINQVYNISYLNLTPLGKTLEHNLQVLSDCSFENRYPNIKKYLRNYLSPLLKFYTALRTLHNDILQTIDGRDVLILTTNEVRQLLDTSTGTARAFLRWITLLSFIDAIHKKELDPTSKAYIQKLSNHNQYEYASMFVIKQLTPELLDTCEAIAENLISLRLTKGNLTLKTIRAITSNYPEDYEVVSPNYSYFKRGAANSAAEEAIQKYSKLLLITISKDGYVQEKSLPPKIKLERANRSGSYSISVEWKEVRSAVLEACNCVAVQSNRDQLALLGVDLAISGILIIPQDKVYLCEHKLGEALNDIALHGYALASNYFPITQNHRKEFRDMLSACGVDVVRLNDALRAKYKITYAVPYTEIFIKNDCKTTE